MKEVKLNKGGAILIICIFLLVVISYYFSLNKFTGYVTYGSCSDDQTIYKIFDSEIIGDGVYNSHVALWNTNDPVYDVRVCASQIVDHNACGISLDNNSQQVVFWLHGSSNSHVAQNNQDSSSIGSTSAYNIPVCYNNRYCYYTQDICRTGYECIGSMSDSYNAHVGYCDEYNMKICCGDQDPSLLCIFGVSYWTDGKANVISSAIKGQLVNLTLLGSNCDGKLVDFNIKEDDLTYGEGVSDDPASIQPTSVVFTGDIATTKWIAEFQNDCLGFCNPPEYYFVTTLNEDPNVAKLSTYLNTYECGNGVREGPEQCETGTDLIFGTSDDDFGSYGIGIVQCNTYDPNLYTGGVISCNSDCSINKNNCEPISCSEVKVTNNIFDQINPDIDGNLIVWEDKRSGSSSIYMNKSGVETMISPSTPTAKKNPRINGNLIVWEDNNTLTSHIVVYNIVSGAIVDIPGSFDVGPDVYKDIVVFRRRNGVFNEIIIYNVLTGMSTVINSVDIPTGYPIIYGDIVLWWEFVNNNMEIYVYKISTDIKTKISTYYRVYGYSLFEKSITWGGQRQLSGDIDIYLYNLTSGTETGFSNPSNQLLPDIFNELIVMQDYRNGNSDIFMYDPVSTLMIPLVTNTAYQGAPAINDGKVVWEDRRDGNTEIYMCQIGFSPCGNGIVGIGEECDCGGDGCSVDELNFETCESLGLGTGLLTCTPQCTFDRNSCTTPNDCNGAPNGICERMEFCDDCDDCGLCIPSCGFNGVQIHLGETCDFLDKNNPNDDVFPGLTCDNYTIGSTENLFCYGNCNVIDTTNCFS